MISGSLLKDFVCSKYTLDFLAEKHNVSKADILAQVKEYSKKTKSSNLANILNLKYKKYLLKAFMASFKNAKDFSQEYRIPTTKFLKFISEIVEDKEFIPSDNLADNIYRKAIKGMIISSSRYPERIVCIIAKRYTSSQYCSQGEIGFIYDINNRTVSNILRRSIIEDIVDDDTAEGIFSRVVKSYSPCPKQLICAYEDAFDKRHVTKLRKQLQQMEAMMESDDECIDYAKLGESIEKLKKQIAGFTQTP